MLVCYKNIYFAALVKIGGLYVKLTMQPRGRGFLRMVAMIVLT
jgi:hypothetical protein